MQELEIILPNNQSVVPISVNKPFQDIDLAVLTFSYSQSLLLHPSFQVTLP